ncbi:MAG: hypothetical protein K6V36_12245 [Anaerolineae bacterium]|nr:hypothetical protein [Anaerolineae bacterium]
MSFLRKLAAIFAGGADSASDAYAYHYYVRCSHCGEVIKARVDLRNELSSEFGEGDGPSGYSYRKVLIGRGRCFQPIEVVMTFDARRKPLSRSVTGGEFVGEEEYYEAQQAASAS